MDWVPGGLDIVCRADGNHGDDTFGPREGSALLNRGWVGVLDVQRTHIRIVRGLTSHPRGHEADRAGSRCELPIVRDQDGRLGAPLAPKDGRSQMDSVERTQRRRERVGSPAEHGGGPVYTIHPLEEAKDEATAIRKFLRVEKSLPKAPIERTQALDLGESARDSLLDGRPLR